MDSNDQVAVEDYRQGYHRFSALVALDDAFTAFRRFHRLRVRLLLLRQDKITLLEKRLDAIDGKEPCPSFLGCRRMDGNTEREAVISEIENALAGYDALIQRSNQVLGFESPESQHDLSLQNWLEGNACIAREESRFLEHSDDLFTFSRSNDRVVSWLERTVSKLLAFLGMWSRPNSSRDPHVHIFPKLRTYRLARTLLAPFVTCLLLVPVAVCNLLESPTARLVVMTTATSVFAMALSLLTKPRTVELAVAGAT
ncbi:hypothetical protein B0T14DRAFT_576202 [Immersiella caudata]|uniref:DUF6594 domain-containing protein n=1 Tax=Immersiella caudata TaxID=314043 RepID=A0AA39XH66_9PEZI|nr:hypothetical protein B0T14DRAFT_576202 [Immersiella caudata]